MWQSSQYYKKLRLGDLPLLAVIEIVKSMRLTDQINLALSSKKYEAVCEIASVKVGWINFHVQDEYTCLDLGESISLCCGNKAYMDEIDKISYRKLSKWLAAGSSATPLQRLVCLFEKINIIFRSGNHYLLIYMNEMKNASVKDVMDVPIFKNCENIALVKGEIESDDLRLVLDMAKHLKYFRILGTKVPSDFQHEKAFTIERIVYEDANWVRLENLLTMRNSTYVTLGTTSLTYTDFNKFLKFWVNSEVDMFINMVINVKEGIDPQVLFDGFLRLDSLRFLYSAYFIIANPDMTNRAHPLLFVDHQSGKLRFLAYSRTSTWLRIRETQNNLLEETKTFQPEFDALRVLEQRKELRKKMEKVEGIDEDDTKMMEELNTKLNVLLAEGKFTIGG